MLEFSEERRTLAEQLIYHFRGARKKAKILPTDHAYVSDAVRMLHETLDSLLAELPSVTLSATNGELYVEGQLFADETLEYTQLVVDLEERDLRGIAFERGVTMEDLAAFIALTNMKPSEVKERGGWERILREEGLWHITLRSLAGPACGSVSRAGGSARSIEAIADNTSLRELYSAALDLIRMSFADAKQSDKLSLDNLENIVSLLVTSLLEDRDVFHGLSTIKDVDEYTFYHSVNVAILSLLMGSKLQLNSSLLYRLGIAAILHDIGKMRIPDEILNKPASLTDEEWKVMQSHSVEGAKFLAGQPKIDPLAVIVATQHHGRYDLTGYPSFGELDQLHIVSNLVAIADVYDALTSDRAYRRGMLPDHAMQLIIEGRGTHFHPQFVKVFAHLSGLFPVGTLVQLDTEELAVVVRANPEDLCRPRVRLLSKDALRDTEFPEVDLTERKLNNRHRRSIVKSVDPAAHGVRVSDFL